MARKIHVSAIEHWVDGYLKRLDNTNSIRKERKFIQKAIVLISQKVDKPCCADPDTLIDLISWRDNQLTNTIRPVIEEINSRDNRKSLLRVLDDLRNALIRCCTTTVTINFNTTEDAKITFYSDFVKKKYVVPTLNGNSSYTLTVPDFGKYTITLEQLNAGDGTILSSAHVNLDTAGVVGVYTQQLVDLDSVYTLADS